MTEQGGARTPETGRALGVAFAVLAVTALTGALLGVLWWVLAPRPEGTSLGGGEVFTGTTEDVFAGEGYFLLITAAAGLITGYAAYMVQFPLTRDRPQDLRLVVLVAGVLGSVAATLLTLWVGTSLDGSVHEAVEQAPAGESVTLGLRLDATAFLAAWPFVFVLQYGLLDLVSMVRRDLPGLAEPEPVQRPDPLPVGVEAQRHGSPDPHGRYGPPGPEGTPPSTYGTSGPGDTPPEEGRTP